MFLKISSGIRKARNGEFDLWKFFSMLIIVLHHSYGIFGNKRLYFAYGSIFVEFFFIVSGYFMAVSVSKKEQVDPKTLGTETVGFIFGKIKKLLPYLVFAWVNAFAAAVVCLGAKEVFTLENFLTVPFTMTFLNVSGIPATDVIGTTWYLSAMFMSMAIIYPLMRRWQDIFSKIAAPLIAVSLYAIMIKKDGYIIGLLGWYGVFCKGFFRGFAGISLGCSVFAASQWLEKKFMYKGMPLLLSFVDIGCMLGSAFLVYRNIDRQYHGVVVLMFYVAVMIIASRKAWINGFFGGELFSKLGKLSMAVYLTHPAVIKWLNFAIENSDTLLKFRKSVFGPPVLTAVLVLLSLAFGAVCIAVTQPLEKKIKAFLKKEKERQSAAE